MPPAGSLWCGHSTSQIGLDGKMGINERKANSRNRTLVGAAGDETAKDNYGVTFSK